MPSAAGKHGGRRGGGVSALSVEVVVLQLRVDHHHFFGMLVAVEFSVLKDEESVIVAPRGSKKPRASGKHPYEPS